MNKGYYNSDIGNDGPQGKRLNILINRSISSGDTLRELSET